LEKHAAHKAQSQVPREGARSTDSSEVSARRSEDDKNASYTEPELERPEARTDKVVPGFNFGGFGFGKQKEKGGMNLTISRPQESLPRKQELVEFQDERSLILSFLAMQAMRQQKRCADPDPTSRPNLHLNALPGMTVSFVTRSTRLARSYMMQTAFLQIAIFVTCILYASNYTLIVLHRSDVPHQKSIPLTCSISLTLMLRMIATQTMAKPMTAVPAINILLWASA
jgi:hypothetical protein